jgi:hypothetical protein
MAGAQDYDAAANRIQSFKDPLQFMGSDPVTLGASADLTLTFEPEYDLNVELLRIADAFAPNVAIIGMKIGPVSMMAGGGAFPGDAFKGSSTLKLALALPVTQKNSLKVTVRNLTTSAITGFYLGVAGRVKRAG